MTATPLDVLGPDDLGAIADLAQRAVHDAPTEGELAGALFTDEQPAIVRGDPAVGVVATVDHWGQGHVRLVMVDPAHRGQGHGDALLAAAEEDVKERGLRTITVGADPPYFLWPGIETSEIELLALVEKRRYSRVEANINMLVSLDDLPPDPGGTSVATADDRDDVDAFMTATWPNWRPEVLRALDKGNLVVSRDDKGVAAFCAFEVNRTGLLGPVAARHDLLGKGAGRPVLVGALHVLRQRGRKEIDVVWVGPVRPYARVGGRVSRVYLVYRKTL